MQGTQTSYQEAGLVEIARYTCFSLKTILVQQISEKQTRHFREFSHSQSQFDQVCEKPGWTVLCV